MIGWDLRCFIVKSNDDLRQEVCCLQARMMLMMILMMLLMMLLMMMLNDDIDDDCACECKCGGDDDYDSNHYVCYL